MWAGISHVSRSQWETWDTGGQVNGGEFNKGLFIKAQSVLGEWERDREAQGPGRRSSSPPRLGGGWVQLLGTRKEAVQEGSLRELWPLVEGLC